MAGFGADIAKLIVLLTLDDKGFTAGMNRARGSIAGVDRGFSQMGRGASQVGRGLTTLGTRAAIAAAGGLTAVVTTAASFEQAFTGVEKTVDATDAQLAELEGQFRQMARTIPVSFEELSAIGEAGGALGIATEDLEEFTDVVARLSVSTNLSSDQAATALGQLGNVLHLSGDDFRDFADSLVALGNAGASTEDQIVSIAARFAAAGNAAGLSKEDILALGSAVASMGIEVEAGGSALSRIFNSVATNIGTSSDKAVAFAETLGLSAKEFRAAWERDALGTFEDFLDELNKLDQFEQANVLKSIGITNTRDVNTVRLMAQNIDLVNDQLAISRDAQGELSEESQKFFDTTAGQWKVLVNNLRDAGATIGTELLPVVKDLIKEFTTFLNDPKTQAKLKTFGQDLAKGARELLTAFKSGEFEPLIENLKGAAQVAKTAFDAFNALPGPVKQFAIAALVANKVSGGALGQITGGLANIFAGGLKAAFGVGGILGRGSSPANPLFVSATGLGGGGGGLLTGGGGLGGLVFKTIGALGLFVALEELAISAGRASGALDKQREGFFDIFGPPKGSQPATSTPIGQFVPGNLGGTRPGIAPGVANAITQSVKGMHKDIQAALRRGDVHAARLLKRQIDALRSLDNRSEQRNNLIVAGLGRTHTALSTANRNLQDGNARQREMAQGIREARDRIGTGFSATNANLGTANSKLTSINAKDFSPNVNVNANFSTTVSISDIIRQSSTYNVATSLGSQLRRGFTP